MKLLPPKELNTKLNEQKKSEIDAGMFLAKKVDALREELSEAQIEHDRAMEGMKKEYDLFLGETVAKKSSLETEIAYLEAKKGQLLIPLDAEWEKVNNFSNSLEEKSKALEAKDSHLISREKDVLKKEQEVTSAHDTVYKSILEVKAEQKKSGELLALRNQQYIKGEERRARDEKERERLLASITDKERSLDYTIKHYKDFEQRLKEKEKQLNLRETRLSIKEHASNRR